MNLSKYIETARNNGWTIEEDTCSLFGRIQTIYHFSYLLLDGTYHFPKFEIDIADCVLPAYFELFRDSKYRSSLINEWRNSLKHEEASSCYCTELAYNMTKLDNALLSICVI